MGVNKIRVQEGKRTIEVCLVGNPYKLLEGLNKRPNREYSIVFYPYPSSKGVTVGYWDFGLNKVVSPTKERLGIKK